MRFDGLDDVVTVTANVSTTNIFSGGGTILAWIYRIGAGGGPGRATICQKSGGGGPGVGWRLGIRGDPLSGVVFSGVLRFEKRFTTSNTFWDSSPNLLPVLSWHHVAVTYDDNNTGNVPFIFIDTILTTSHQSAPALGSGAITDDTAAHLYIGSTSGLTRTFGGFINHLHLYNKILTQGEIRQLSTMPGSITDKLVGYWPLIEVD